MSIFHVGMVVRGSPKLYEPFSDSAYQSRVASRSLLPKDVCGTITSIQTFSMSNRSIVSYWIRWIDPSSGESFKNLFGGTYLVPVLSSNLELI